MKKRLFILGFLLSVITLSYSQKNADSAALLVALEKATEDTGKVNLLNDLGIFYSEQSPSKSLNYLQMGLELAKKLDYSKGEALILTSLGTYYYNRSDFDKAKEVYFQNLKINENSKDSASIRVALTNIAIVFINKGDYQNALSYTLQSLKMAECLHDSEGVSRTYNSIAQIYYYKGDSAKVVEYMEKALKISQEIGNKELSGYYYNNLGNVYYSQNKFDKALQNYMMGLQTAQEMENKNEIASGLGNIGAVYHETGYFEKAMEYFEKAIRIYEEMGDITGKLSPLINMGEIYSTKGNFAKAIECFMESFKIARDAGMKESIKDSYWYMATTYAKMKDYQNAYKYNLLYSKMKDTLLNETNNKQITEMQTKYDTEKKDNEILLLNKDKKIKDEAMQKQRIIIYSFIFGFIIILIFSILLYRQYNAKRKANIILAEQKKEIQFKNAELNQQNEEIAAQRDEIEAQRDLVTKQKDHIEEIHSELVSSINYAERIQHAVLPSEEFIKEILKNIKPVASPAVPQAPPSAPDYFIIFRPRDIVSGDFYWVAKRNEWLLIAVADCTGHGVPGGFMSMLGISFLNDIIAREEVMTASQVLNWLRLHVVKSLQQRGINQEQKDGMDMVFIAFNTNTYQLQFAGANNPLYVIASASEAISVNTTPPSETDFALKPIASPAARNDECRLKEIKGDKMPVAIHSHMNPFTNHVFQVHQGDTLYMCTDGFEDQFGGPNGRKFLSRRLRELISSNCEKPLQEQKTLIADTLDAWQKGHETKYEQTDDITLMGLLL